MRYAVIIAGGAGTRLWPMSRTGKPKQLLPFIPTAEGPRSLLSLAAARTRGLIDPNNLYICTNAAFTSQILADLPTLPESQILPEPIGRDTVNAVAFAAAVLHKLDPDSSFLVLTADHIIEPLATFQAVARAAFDFVESHGQYLLTFGIRPTHAATGYGYLHLGPSISSGSGNSAVSAVQSFKEKPNAELAEQYVASGEYLWNSGMFVFKTATYLEQLQKLLPQSYSGIMRIAEAWGTPQQGAVIQAVYPTLPKISIDFAIMEKAPLVGTLALPVQWLDVGSWPAFAQTLSADAQGNRTSGAVACHLDSTNTLAIAEAASSAEPHLIGTINTHDLMIIHTPRATLVCPMQDAERIKQLVSQLEQTGNKTFI